MVMFFATSLGMCSGLVTFLLEPSGRNSGVFFCEQWGDPSGEEIRGNLERENGLDIKGVDVNNCPYCLGDFGAPAGKTAYPPPILCTLRTEIKRPSSYKISTFEITRKIGNFLHK